ncbi:hypothetical protein Tco_0173710 [Tanacetum coccineum]
MVDVPIHQEDPAVQRTPLIDTVISMGTDKTTSTPTPPTTQAHVQMCSTSCCKDSSRESRKLYEWTCELYQKDPTLLLTFIRVIRMVRFSFLFPDPARARDLPWDNPLVSVDGLLSMITKGSM